MKTRKVTRAKANVAPTEPSTEVHLGSGAPVGLVVGGHAASEDDSLSTRLAALKERFAGAKVEHQPVEMVDGKVKYRWVLYTADGAAIPGNGDDDHQAFANLESRLSAWEASS